MAIGDVDGDGNPDIVTNGVTVYFGDGKGGFPRRRDWFNDAPGSIILTDFGGDGEIDIVLGTGNAQVLAGDRVDGFVQSRRRRFFGRAGERGVYV